MKTLVTLLACLGQTFLVFTIITGIRTSNATANTNTFINLLLLITALLDLTVVNIFVWRAVKKAMK